MHSELQRCNTALQETYKAQVEQWVRKLDAGEKARAALEEANACLNQDNALWRQRNAALHRKHLALEEASASLQQSNLQLQQRNAALAEDLQESQDLAKHLTMYTAFLQGKLETMMEASLHGAGEDAIRAIASKTYAQWKGVSDTMPPPPPSHTDTNARTRREMRLLTVWGWDAPR